MRCFLDYIRLSSSKVYNAVPPPQLLSTTVQSSGYERSFSTARFTSTASLAPAPAVPGGLGPGVTSAISQGSLSHSGGTLNPSLPQLKAVSYPQSVLTRGTSYSGYEGIYPQATPLQQVALALRQSSSAITSAVAHTASVAMIASKPSDSSMSEKEKRNQQKRKFQELPVGSKGSAKVNQVLVNSFIYLRYDFYILSKLKGRINKLRIEMVWLDKVLI